MSTAGPASRTWLITGVSSGLGRALAQAAIDRGHRVWGTVRSQSAVEAFEALADARVARASVADMTEPDRVLAAVDEAQATFGPIDVLVNNAGYGLVGAIEEVSRAEALRQFATNVLGPLSAIQAVLPSMRARGSGHIVNVTSVSGLATWAGTGVYCASKSALEAIGMTLADEVAPLGIKVTNVAPGGLRTDYAGRSLVRAEKRIEDYAHTAHPSEQIMADYLGREPNEPVKAAQAILTLVELDQPPRHLLLGEDALRYASADMAALQADIDRWRHISSSVGAEPGPGPSASQ